MRYMSDSCDWTKIVSDLTEYETNYRFVNIPLQNCYFGLPANMAKLSGSLFDLIIKNKMYNEKGKEKNVNENKRVYSDITVTLEELAQELYPIKYAETGDLSNDLSNLDKRIKDLHDNNVFYCWKYKSNLIFVMEREIVGWKYYNPQAYLPPKTLKKILHLGQDIMMCMGKAAKRYHGKLDSAHMENSFGWFLNDLVSKMNPMVSADIPKWEDKGNLVEYCKILAEKLKGIGNYDGLCITGDFLKRLPRTVKWKIYKSVEKKEMKNNVDKELRDSLIPTTPHISRRKVGIKAKKEIAKKHEENVPVSSPVPLVYGGDIDPFKDSLAFMKYYHMFIQTHVSSRARFESYSIDSLSSASILDALIDKGKNNKEFLDAWLDYFCKNSLKGTKCMKPKYTSMKLFSETLEDFCQRFYIPQ